MARKTVVVVGGGTGGIVAARRLRKRLDRDDRVVLVAREPRYCFAPSFLWVMTGDRRPERICRDVGQLRGRGIEVVEAEALGLDAGERRLETAAGELRYDRLVLAVGADLTPEALPGFAEGVLTPYTLDGARRTQMALEGFGGGRVVVLVPRLPFKCPAAPYETAFLVEALLRRRGLRDKSSIDVHTAESAPMPVAGPVVGEAVVQLLGTRGIGFHPQQTVEAIDPQARSVTLADGGQVEYDLALGVPPHAAPALARASGLASDSGYIPVDPRTLATPVAGVYAIGDITAIPLADGKLLPKAGVFAHAQAEAVSQRIADELAGRTPRAAFTGHGSCFLETGEGTAGYASGNFYAPGGADVKLKAPGRTWHLGKVLFEQYWLRRWA